MHIYAPRVAWGHVTEVSRHHLVSRIGMRGEGVGFRI